MAVIEEQSLRPSQKQLLVVHAWLWMDGTGVVVVCSSSCAPEEAVSGPRRRPGSTTDSEKVMWARAGQQFPPEPADEDLVLGGEHRGGKCLSFLTVGGV